MGSRFLALVSKALFLVAVFLSLNGVAEQSAKSADLPGASVGSAPKYLDCELATSIMAFALGEHVLFHELTPELAGRTMERFGDRVKIQFGHLLSAADLKAMEQDLQSTSQATVAKAWIEGRCTFFEKQMARVTKNFLSIESTLRSPEVLAGNLIVYSRTLNESAYSKTMALLSAQVEQWKNEVPIIDAANYVARRYIRASTDLDSKLIGLPYEVMIKSFMNALDAHSVYMNEKELARFKEEEMTRSYTGVGMSLGNHPRGLRIFKLVQGGTAEADGHLHVGQIITAVDDRDVLQEDLEDSVARIKGPAQTFVTLSVADLDSSGTLVNFQNVRLLRKSFEKSSTNLISRRTVVDGKNVVTVKLGEFYPGCSWDVAEEILKRQKEAPIDALVLDLRDNPGGDRGQAIGVVGLFIKVGNVLGVRDGTGNVEELQDRIPLVAYDGPLVVAVNDRSASASEIVAGSLSDYDRALVAGGAHTYGKGSVQRIRMAGPGPFDLKSNMIGGLRLTVEQYYNAGGTSPQCTGVLSDIEVPGGPEPLKPDQLECGRKYSLPADSLHHPVYLWSEFKENADPMIHKVVSGLQTKSRQRVALKTPRNDDEQLQEIEHIAADYSAARH